MPRTLEEPTRRINIHLFTRDIDRIHMFCQRGKGGAKIPFNQAVRMMVHTMLDTIERKMGEAQAPVDMSGEVDMVELELE